MVQCVPRLKKELFSCSVVSDSLRPHARGDLQHARLPCPSLFPRVCSNSCPLSRWYYPTISSSVVPFSSCFQSFPSIRIFPNELALCIRWPEYWSFSINPSNECSGLISFRIDWNQSFRIDLLAVQRTLESSPAPQLESINSLALSLLYGPTLRKETPMVFGKKLGVIDFVIQE